MVGIVLEYGHFFCPVALHLWNIYLLSLKLAGFKCDPHHVIFRFPFCNRTHFLISYLSFFWAEFAKECTIVGLVYPVWYINNGMMVEFVVMWYLVSSLLSQYSWRVRSDTTSSSSSALAAKSFNFQSKVVSFVGNLCLDKPLAFNLSYREVMVANSPVIPQIFSLMSLATSSQTSDQPFPYVLF